MGHYPGGIGAARKALRRRHIGGYVEDAATPRAALRAPENAIRFLHHTTRSIEPDPEPEEDQKEGLQESVWVARSA
jgi:hypothetical protein